MIVKSKPVVKTFKLKCDESGEAYVTILQGTWAEDKERADIYTTQRTVLPINEGEHPITEENRNRARIMEHEIKTVLTEIGGFSDAKGNDVKLFRFKESKSGVMKVNMTDKEFSDAVAEARFDSEVIEEIHDCVLEMNPTWGTPREKKKENAEAGKPDDPLGESKTTSEE